MTSGGCASFAISASSGAQGGLEPVKVMAQYQAQREARNEAQNEGCCGWIYHCDDIVVEPRAHRLERAGVSISVEPKAYAVLVVLLQQAGDVVGKNDLLDAAWGHRHVTPGVLTRVISQLRHSLGDCANDPRYIATVHSLGYRFIGDVQRVAVTPLPPSTEVEAIPAQLPASVPPWSAPKATPLRWFAAAITVVMIVAMLAAASLWHAPDDHLGAPHTSPRPALVLMPYLHANDIRPLHPRRWPRTHRIATDYGSDPNQLRAARDLLTPPEPPFDERG